MQGKNQKAIIINEYRVKPTLQQTQIPFLQAGELLVKVQASTINPSDRLFLEGNYFKKTLPTICGFEGTGNIVQAKDYSNQHWVGKRVNFLSNKGSWCQYTTTTPDQAFYIDEQVNLASAASGIINPLTAIGFIQNYRRIGCKGGIIHTAAASALGRMFIKLCKKENVPLLNIVRKCEQASLLIKQGASNVIVTSIQDWERQLKQSIIKNGYDCVYDALGGGYITQKIIQSLAQESIYHIYGKLQQKPLNLSQPFVLFGQIQLRGFLVFKWWARASNQVKEKVRNQYSWLLKNILNTQTYKQLSLKQLDEALQLSVQKSNQGKILLKIQ